MSERITLVTVYSSQAVDEHLSLPPAREFVFEFSIIYCFGKNSSRVSENRHVLFSGLPGSNVRITLRLPPFLPVAAGVHGKGCLTPDLPSSRKIDGGQEFRLFSLVNGKDASKRAKFTMCLDCKVKQSGYKTVIMRTCELVTIDA